MATKVQTAFGNGSSVVITGVTAGNLLVIVSSYFRGSGTSAPATPTDTNGTVSVASADSPADSGSGVGGAAIWYVKNTNSGTHTIANLEASHNTTVTEYSGSDTTNPFDVAKSSTSVVNGHTSQSTGTTATTGQANELVVICFGIGASPGAANMGLTDPVSGFTTLKLIQDDQSDIGTQHAFKNVSATGTQSATFNWTDTSTAESSMGCIATFKDAASGNAASSDGVGSATAVGSSTAAVPASSDGVGLASGVGAATSTADASSDGVGTATAVGASSATSVATSDGVGTASAEGISSATALLSSDGIGLANAEGISTATADASSDGVAVGTLVGQALSTGAADASSDGVSTADAQGVSSATADASTDGISTADAVGQDASQSQAQQGVTTTPDVGSAATYPRPSSWERQREKRRRALEIEDEEIMQMAKIAIKQIAQDYIARIR